MISKYLVPLLALVATVPLPCIRADLPLPSGRVLIYEPQGDALLLMGESYKVRWASDLTLEYFTIKLVNLDVSRILATGIPVTDLGVDIQVPEQGRIEAGEYEIHVVSDDLHQTWNSSIIFVLPENLTSE